MLMAHQHEMVQGAANDTGLVERTTRNLVPSVLDLKLGCDCFEDGGGGTPTVGILRSTDRFVEIVLAKPTAFFEQGKADQ